MIQLNFKNRSFYRNIDGIVYILNEFGSFLGFACQGNIVYFNNNLYSDIYRKDTHPVTGEKLDTE